MRGPYVAATIRAEVKRAMRDGRPIDRPYLHEETRLPWDILESALSRINREVKNAMFRCR